jgi:hypothetical protein
MTSNIFVVHAPGLGGNHLANILSLGDDYTARCDIADYDNKLDGTAHFGASKNIEFDKLKDQVDLLKHQNNVFCGHVYQYYSFTKTNLLKDNFHNRKYLVIQFPVVGSIAYNRMLNWNLGRPMSQEINLYPAVISDLGLLYKPDVIRTMFNEDKDTAFYLVDPDLLFNEDINVLFDSLTRQKFNISVDRRIAHNLHTKWLDNLRKTKNI